MAADQRKAHGIQLIPGIGARHAHGFSQIGSLSIERRWELYDDAFQPCYDAAREWAKYRYYWDARTRWLFDHAGERDTARFLERRAKRQSMIEPMNQREQAFLELAFDAQECARWNLGPEFFADIKERYDVDYRRTGTSIDVFVNQWAFHLTWNPEPCPF
jgi:hypothetical protein